VKVVDSIDEAIAHINEYGSHHTDAILSVAERRSINSSQPSTAPA
jgi:gamma-glutamyl phosphate reductase